MNTLFADGEDNLLENRVVLCIPPNHKSDTGKNNNKKKKLDYSMEFH